MKKDEMPIFMELPCVMFNSKGENLTAKKNIIYRTTRINPKFIVEYCPSAFNKKDDEWIDCIQVYHGVGVATILLSVEEFEEKLEEYKSKLPD